MDVAGRAGLRVLPVAPAAPLALVARGCPGSGLSCVHGTGTFSGRWLDARNAPGPPRPCGGSRVTATAWDALALKFLTDFSLVFRQERSCGERQHKFRR